MTALSLRLPDNLIAEVDFRASSISITRNEYIKRSLELMNQQFIKIEKQHKLKKASQLVRINSMLINNEFAAVEHDIKA